MAEACVSNEINDALTYIQHVVPSIHVITAYQHHVVNKHVYTNHMSSQNTQLHLLEFM